MEPRWTRLKSEKSDQPARPCRGSVLAAGHSASCSSGSATRTQTRPCRRPGMRGYGTSIPRHTTGWGRASTGWARFCVDCRATSLLFPRRWGGCCGPGAAARRRGRTRGRADYPSTMSSISATTASCGPTRTAFRGWGYRGSIAWSFTIWTICFTGPITPCRNT